MSDTRAAIIARLAARLGTDGPVARVYGTAPATARRKRTDTPDPHYNTGYDPTAGANAGQYAGTPRRNTNASRMHGGQYPGYFQVDTEYLAGADPATTRPSYDGRVKPAGGRKIGVKRADTALESVNAGTRAWVAERTNVVIAAGDEWPAMWPDGSQPGSY